MAAATALLFLAIQATVTVTPSATHKCTIPVNDGAVRCVAISPDSKIVAGGGDGLVQLFDLKTGKRLHQLKGHTRPVLSIAFTPDAKAIASSSADGTVRLWNVQTGRLVRTFQAQGRRRNGIRCIAVSPDGKSLISCGAPGAPSKFGGGRRHDVYLWNLKTGRWDHFHERGNTVVFDEKPLRHVTISPNGRHVAMAEGAGNVRLNDVNFGLGKRFCWKHDDRHEVTWVAFAPDSRRLLSCGRDNTLRTWDVKSGKSLLKIAGSNQDIDLKKAMMVTEADRQRGAADLTKFDRNGDGIIDKDEILATNWSASLEARTDLNRDGRISRDEAIRRWTRARRDALATPICFQAAAFLPDGSRLVSVTRDERIQFWDAAGGKLLGSVTGDGKAVTAIALSKDGTILATCGGDKVIRIWELRN